MDLAASNEPAILPSNVGEVSAPARNDPDSDSETFADLTLVVGALALLATGLTVIGYHFGGPVPNRAFWGAFGPLLLLPAAILLGVSLAPGGLLQNEPAPARKRIGLAFVGLSLFGLLVSVLNVPTILLLGR